MTFAFYSIIISWTQEGRVKSIWERHTAIQWTNLDIQRVFLGWIIFVANAAHFPASPREACSQSQFLRWVNLSEEVIMNWAMDMPIWSYNDPLYRNKFDLGRSKHSTQKNRLTSYFCCVLKYCTEEIYGGK